jgi:nucleotide-binding universal stress UspA family protein
MVEKIAVGLDASATAGEAVKMAAELARKFDAELVLLSVYKHAAAAGDGHGADREAEFGSRPEAVQREAVARAQDRLREEGVRCSTLAGEGHPGDVLVRLAEECDADVLVVGNKGIHRRVLGSIPNTVTHKAPCSVLVVKTT